MPLNETPNPRTGEKDTYNYCQICGHRPKSEDTPNRGPVRWWDPDDGWKIGTLCVGCKEDNEHVRPKEGDFAFRRTNGIADAIDTEDDCIGLLDTVDEDD